MRATPEPILAFLVVFGIYYAITWQMPRSNYAPPPAAHQIRQDGARRVWCAFGMRRIGTCQAAHPANITKAKVLMLASLPLMPRLLFPAEQCAKAGRCPSTTA